jgi:hypothetical protein
VSFVEGARKAKASYTHVVTTQNPSDINWADVAARARAELGDEPVVSISKRLRTIMMITAGALGPNDAEGLRFGQPPGR